MTAGPTQRRSGAGSRPAVATSSPETRGGSPESVGEILRRVLREVRPSHRRRTAVADAWAEAAGPEIAAETRPATLQRGVLVVEVRSSGLLAELQGFRHGEILARLLAAEPTGKVNGLRFRPGVF